MNKQGLQMGKSIRYAWSITLVAFPLLSSMVSAQSVLLEDARKVSDLQHVQVSLKVEGTLQADRVGNTDETPKATVAANGWLTYQERILALRPSTSTEPPGAVAGRYYESAQAKMQIDDHEESVQLNDDQKIVLARSSHETDFSSARTPLSESELEMIMVPGNSLAVYNLLPGKEVSVGERWEHAPQDVASLLNLDEVTECDASSRLITVEKGLARMQFAGTILGHANGAATELQIEGDYRYDLRWKRINWLSMVIKEDRQSSAARPGFGVSAELKMLVGPLKECPQLDPQALEQVARVYKNQERLLRFDSPQAGYSLLHSPEWKVLNDHPQNTSFRMVDGGKTIAQCNIRRLKKQEAGKPLTLKTFQADIETALGDRFGRFVKSREFDRRDGYRVLHVAAQGVVTEIPVQWVYYHVTSPTGECGSYVYTMEMDAVETFASQDTQMVNSLELIALAPSVGTTDGQTADESSPSAGKDAATADRTGAAPPRLLRK